MRRKRLKHAADTFCDMFCGWRLANSYDVLPSLGSGKLLIDVLNGNCQFNNNIIDPVNIGLEINSWFIRDIRGNNIPEDGISSATLVANLEIKIVEIKRKKGGTIYIDNEGMPIKRGAFYSLKIDCSSEIVTDEECYKCNKKHHEQWPVGWPNT